MINVNLKKRILTSIVLILLLVLMYCYFYILLLSLIVISLISWIEFYGLIIKIFKKDNLKNKIYAFIYKLISLIYLFILVFFILNISTYSPELKIFIIYPILVSILSDIGGLIIGKTFKGKKLTKISPKKTISGVIGSFAFSLFLIPFFIKVIVEHNFLSLLIITLIISLVSQLGDLLISFLKRKAKVKDTSDLLPGHGGVLDRIDGIILAIPFGFFLFNYF
jgi:phosphatidate cytidylyltransferase